MSRVLGGFIAAILLAFAPVRAEVSGLYDDFMGRPRIIILGIGDDADPFPTVWHRFTSAPQFKPLNAEGEANGDGVPTIVVHPETREGVAAWSINRHPGFDIVVSRFTGGAWTAPTVVVDVAADALDPMLAVGDDGAIHMTYWTDDGTTRRVWHRQAPADLSSWSSPTAVSAPSESACRPSIAVHQGVVRVAYEVHEMGFGSAPRQVVLARLDAGGFVPEIVAETSESGPVRPQVHSQTGRLWVDWIDHENPSTGAGELGWTRQDAAGHWDPLHYEPYASTTEREYGARAAVRLKAQQ